MTAAGKALGNEPIGAVSAVMDADGAWHCPDYMGLTKREHFAGLALEGLQANSHDGMANWEPELRASWAVRCADALLDELAKDRP